MARRIISASEHDDGVDRWGMVAAAPADALAGRIGHYGFYREETRSFAARRELAATSGVLIFALGEPLSIIGADGAEIVLRAGEGFVGGPAEATSISRALGAQAGMHIFMPLSSLAATIGAPVAEIANRAVALAEFGRGARIGERLAEAADAEARFTLLDDYFTARFAEAQESDRAVRWAMARLECEAPPPIATIAAEIGWSRKHLAQRFRAAIGLSPQSYRRLARFERLARAIEHNPGESLAMLAAGAGYADQPHMTREVQAFSAMTPAELRGRLLPAGGVRED